jgi:hypothetical protein
MSGMKLYVWKDVLYGYSAGMIVALAPDLESALATVEEGYVRAVMGEVKPTVIDLADDVKPQSWWVHGGG